MFLIKRTVSCLQGINSCLKSQAAAQTRLLHVTAVRRGLEEFFDQPANWGETEVKCGKNSINNDLLGSVYIY